MSRSAAIAAGSVVLLLTLVASAQQAPPQQTPVFRASVDLVHLDVSVLDKERRPVRGLTAADFNVVEDGKPQSIVAFSAVDVPENPPTPAAWSGRAPADVQSNEGVQDPEGRLFVVLLDDAMLPPLPGSLETARQFAKKFIDRVTPADRVAVVFSANGRNQNFTNDRARLFAAIDSLKAGHASHLGGWDSAMIPPAANGLEPGTIPPVYSPLFDPDMAYRQQSMGTLRQVAETLISAPQRRKALVFISPGIAIDVVSSATPTKVENATSANQRVSIREANRSLALGMPDLFNRMRRANVTVYPIDPCGADGLRQYVLAAASALPALRLVADPVPLDFDWLNPGDAIPRAPDLAAHVSTLSQDFLVEAAKNTGGLAVINTNDFDDGLERIFRENSSYYLLGYQTGPQAPGSLHRISVSVKNRPDVTVRARSGYQAPEAPKPGKGGKMPEPPSPLDKAITGAVPEGAVPMRVALAPFVVPGRKDPTVTIVLGLSQPPVTRRSVFMVDLQTNAYTPDGRPRLVGQRHTARVVLVPTNDKDQARYDLLSEISLPPGRYELRMSAHRGADNMNGSLYADLEVPDFTAPLAVSGVVVETTPAGATAPIGAFDMFLPVVPTSSRQFTQDQDVIVFMRLYQGGKGSTMPVEVKTRLVNEFDAPVGDGRDIVYGNQFRVGGRAADYRFAVPVRKLPPGPYLLTFEISLGEATVSRSVQFTVLK